jgi:hypothetical protein
LFPEDVFFCVKLNDENLLYCPNFILDTFSFENIYNEDTIYGHRIYNYMSNEKLESFKEDRIIYRLLMEVGTRLGSLNIFLQNIPVHTDIVKDFGENVEGERIRNFYYLLDNLYFQSKKLKIQLTMKMYHQIR